MYYSHLDFDEEMTDNAYSEDGEEEQENKKTFENESNTVLTLRSRVVINVVAVMNSVINRFVVTATQ